MFVVWWIVVGVLAGLFAKFLMPGRDHAGWTLLWLAVNIVGALIGGACGLLFFYGGARSGSGAVLTHPHLWVQLIFAATSSVLASIIYRFIAGRRMPVEHRDVSDHAV